MDKKVYLFVCPDLADWEPALAIAMISGLNPDIPKKRSYNIVTFGLTKERVKTVGGITILPDGVYDEIDPNRAAMVLLPGSTLYEKEDPAVLFRLSGTASGIIYRWRPYAEPPCFLHDTGSSIRSGTPAAAMSG
jgi:hypothetical protein